MYDLTGKVVVVTGASSGMGAQITTLFVQHGANVVAVARRVERLDTLVDALKDAPGKVVAYPGDVSKREDVDGMIDAAIRNFGRLDVLVNNAGVMDDMAPIASVSDEKFEHVMAVNVYGPMAAMRKACQVFLDQGNGGNIINISSVGSMHQVAGPLYCASKAAVNTFTRSTAFMYKTEGIRCNAIAPGGIGDTEIGTSMGKPNVEGYGKIEGLLKLMPQAGKAADIAKVALFLASEESAYINGAIIPVDGGWISF